MRRARTDADDEPVVKKKQATLGAFFRRADGQPLSDPVTFYLSCPYCDFRAQSDISTAPLPGALRAHVQWSHSFEHLEASTRLQAALSALDRSIYDLIPMETIVEADVVEDEPEGRPAAEVPDAHPAPEPSAKRLRHSYSIKSKFKILEVMDKAEAVVKASLAADSPYFLSPVVEDVSKKTGVPISTLWDWIHQKDSIREKYATKRLRRIRRVGSGRLAAFPKAEAIVRQLILDKRRLCKLVSKSFVLKHLKLEAEKEDPAKFAQTKFSSDMISSWRMRFLSRSPLLMKRKVLPTPAKLFGVVGGA